jgi:transposase-like protein
MSWTPRPKRVAMSKEALREQSERLMKDARERNVPVTQGKTRHDVKCGKCGAPNRVSVESGEARVEFKCKECGHSQTTL